jgi:hypothetical protein
VAFKAKEADSDPSWGKIAEFIFSSKPGKIPKYMDAYKPFNEDINRYKNLPFLYNKVSTQFIRKSLIRKSRRTGVNTDADVLQHANSIPKIVPAVFGCK